MAESNVNKDMNEVKNEMKQMIKVLSQSVKSSEINKVSDELKSEVHDAIVKGIKETESSSLNLGDKIDIDETSLKSKIENGIVKTADNAIKDAQNKIKDFNISPNLKFDISDIDYAKIKSQLDKILKKGENGSNISQKENQRYLDLIKTSSDYGSTLGSKYYQYADHINKNSLAGNYSPKNIAAEFVDAAKVIEAQNRIWAYAIEYLSEYISYAHEAAKANKNILQFKDDGSPSGFVNPNDIKDKGTNVSQVSLKTKLKTYLEDPTDYNFNVLAAYTNALGNMSKAEELFGKRHSDLFQKVIEYIDQARLSADAFSSSQNSFMMALNELGLKKIDPSNLREFKDILLNQGLQAGLEYLENELKMDLPQAVKEGFNEKPVEELNEVLNKASENLELNENQAKETSEAFDQMAKSAEKAKDSYQWIRGETGGANLNQDTYTVADSKFKNSTIRNSVDKKGNLREDVREYINMDKLAKEIIKHDTEILNLEYKIAHTQGDTSGLQENLGILKQQRSEYERMLNEIIENPYYETNESQKEILTQQRAINEEMIRNEQYTKDAIVQSKNVAQQEKERLKLEEERANLRERMRSITAERKLEEDKNQEQILNALLSEQEQAYKNIYNIKTNIAKLDPQKNSLEIQELEKQERLQKEIFVQKTQEIKALDSQYRSEDLINRLVEIRKNALLKIDQINARKQDKVSELQNDSQLKLSKQVTDALEKETKAVEKRNNARRELQDKANTEIADSHNKTAIALYQELNKNIAEYYEFKKKAATESGLNATELTRLDELETKWKLATAAEQEYSTAVKGSQNIIDKSESERLRFNSSDQNVALKQAKSLDDMAVKLQNIGNNSKYLSRLREDANKLSKEIVELNSKPIDLKADGAIEDLARLSDAYDKIVQRSQVADEKLAAPDTIAKLNLQIEEFIQKNSKMGRVFREQFEGLKLDFDTETSLQEVRDVVAELNKLKAEVTAAGKTGASSFQNLANRIKQMSTNFIAMYFSLYDIARYGRQAFDTIKDLDYALVDLRKTTTMNIDDLNEFYNSANDVAKRMGTSTKEIIDQASAWSRLGYNTKDTSEQMAELSSQFAAISPGMDLDLATDGLVSTMKAFHIDVSEVEREVMDNINRIGNTMATSNSEIVEMLTRSSAAMNAANNSIEETIALESAAVQITRNAETTGTAFRTISMRIRGKSLPPYRETYMLCA